MGRGRRQVEGGRAILFQNKENGVGEEERKAKYGGAHL